MTIGDLFCKIVQVPPAPIVWRYDLVERIRGPPWLGLYSAVPDTSRECLVMCREQPKKGAYMKHKIFALVKKGTVGILAAALLVGGTSISVSAAAFSAQPQRQSARVVDREELHLSTVAQLIRELPDDYTAFGDREHRDFSRAKHLVEELSRSEMMGLIDRHEDAFNKYNDLFRQEKEWFAKV